MTRSFLFPEGGLTRPIVQDALGLVGVVCTLEVIGRWCEIERLIAYDWAMREHLHGSDSRSVRRRPRPSFLDPAKTHRVVEGCASVVEDALDARAAQVEPAPDEDAHVRAMRERPILFSTPMVQAILAGRKTVTRRVVTTIAGKGRVRELQKSQSRGYDLCFRDSRGLWNDMPYTTVEKRSPYGAPGDRLWVRETWGVWHDMSSDTNERAALDEARGGVPWAGIVYKTGSDSPPWRWRPSIHMPRWASRITLEVVSVRVERLQEITEEDARAEGVRPSDAAVVFQNDASGRPHQRGDLGMTYLGAFTILWDKINGSRAPWESNPWVWRMEFRRCT